MAVRKTKTSRAGRAKTRRQARGRTGERAPFGIAAITHALHGLEFPATKDEVLECAGDQRVTYRKGQPMRLREVIERTDLDDFPSMAHVVQAVSGSLSGKRPPAPRRGRGARGRPPRAAPAKSRRARA